LHVGSLDVVERSSEAEIAAAVARLRSRDVDTLDVGARVAARKSAIGAAHGQLGRLLEVLHDADEHTPRVLHAVYGPLGPAAIEHARSEILARGESVRKPSAYAVRIGQRMTPA